MNWIKCTDQLPIPYKWVLVLYETDLFKRHPTLTDHYGPMGVAFVYPLPKEFDTSWSCMWKVTHWMELPEVPQDV